ncbi:MAG: signal peptidase II [bacterium]
MIFSLVIFVSLIIDQVSKYFIEKNLVYGESIPIIKNIFYFTYIKNKGVAFGLFSNFKNILVFFTIITIIIIFFYYHSIPKKNHKLQLAFSLIIGGAFGNLIDRLFLGEVRDFLDFRIWPIFNVADSCICIGVGLLLLNAFIERKLKCSHLK